MKRNIPQYMYISRYTKPRCFWLLRFRHGGKCVHSEVFSDARYSTSEHALLAALEKRNQLALDYGIDLATHWNSCKTKKYRYTHKRSGHKCRTGVIGVTVVDHGHYLSYRASINFVIGVEKVKNFNSETMGKREAFTAAVLQRRIWEKELLKNNLVNK